MSIPTPKKYVPYKDVIRKKVLSFIDEAFPKKAPIKMLSLPGMTWNPERELLKRRPESILHAVERELKIWKKSFKKMPDGNVLYSHSSLLRFLKEAKKSERIYNVFWLDLMSPNCDELHETLKFIEPAKNGSLFILTVLAGREQGIYVPKPKGNSPHARCFRDVRRVDMVMEALHRNDIHVEFHNFERYIGTGNQVMLVLFTRIKRT